MSIKNAIIKSTFIGFEDHGILTLEIDLDYGNSFQSFGGYDLRSYGSWPIEQILKVLECKSLDQLKGLSVRANVGGWNSRINSIGHIIKDKWFSYEDFKK